VGEDDVRINPEKFIRRLDLWTLDYSFFCII
jgi:hypothetical protein